MKQTSYYGIFENEQKFYTKNLTTGSAFFNESLLRLDSVEYRYFDPTRSKFAAGLKKKMGLVFHDGDVVLYLGASHGYTVSYLSDIIGLKGIIFAVDSAYKVFRSLFHVSTLRHNVIPIYADAAKPASYARNICAVDVIYQDIAQKEQADIFDANYALYAKEGAVGILVVKARSIDVTAQPSKVTEGVKKKMLALGYTVLETKMLDPFEQDHALMIVTKGERLKKKSSTHTA
ncbi:fibrillarin-like rRNA/tRNA 2'-O-methyltransferase [Candidatus Woesearchaeota archaeon]|nr:fibrillarin-like rRNA/tRNA 2'-O-methyltransferase [Candidatus Woesearchaeota archaeon]